MKFSFLQHSHHATIDSDCRVVFCSHNLQPVVSPKVSVNSHVFGSQYIVGDQLVSHQIEASASKHGTTRRVVMQGDGHRFVGGDLRSSGVLRCRRPCCTCGVGGTCKGQRDGKWDAGGMSNQIL